MADLVLCPLYCLLSLSPLRNRLRITSLFAMDSLLTVPFTLFLDAHLVIVQK